MHHIHTDEDITITYKRDGKYDEAALEKLNWFLRDWRRSESTKMDPHLIDLVWEVQREAGNKAPIWVVCGYRSPQTNAMLRHRSSGVARFSQHMLGHAMDFYVPGVSLTELRVIGLRLARGGVGFYPTSGSPFVHMDTGSVRMWPRMTRQELAHVFPDGRTVQIPSDGKPMAGYALALADIQKHGAAPSANSVATARAAGIDVGSVETEVASDEPSSRNPFAKLFGFKKSTDEDDEADAAAAPSPTIAEKARTKVKAVAVAAAEKVKAAATKVAAAETKLIHGAAAPAARTAAAPPAAAPAPQNDPAQRVAAASATTVITARGYWQGQPEAGTTAVATALRPRIEVASADPNTTASVGALPGAAVDRVPPALALGYAAPPSPSAATEAAASAVIGQSATTVAEKGVNDRPKTSFQRAIQLAATAVKASERLDNPWLRALIVSPNVHHFLTTLVLGTKDLTTLAGLMVKPASSVMMTFTSDPSLELTQDRFSGSAIVFLPTITYPTARTAALQ
jgi:uncharacterized protein YcbK (DUF882 family)